MLIGFSSLVGFFSVVEYCILADFLVIVLSITEGKVLKSPTVIVELSISPFSSSVFCFTNFGALLFEAYRFKIAMSSQTQIDPFINVSVSSHFLYPEVYSI